MTALTTGTWVFAALLAVAGVAKLTNPGATGAALQGARLPSHPAVVRALGLYELALGALVILVGGVVPASALAVTYGAFAVFVGRQSRRGEDCGCFGQAAAPATWLHVGVNTAAALAAAGAAWRPGAGLPALAAGDPLTGVIALALLMLATAAVRLLLTALPELNAATTRVLREAEA